MDERMAASSVYSMGGRWAGQMVWRSVDRMAGHLAHCSAVKLGYM